MLLSGANMWCISFGLPNCIFFHSVFSLWIFAYLHTFFVFVLFSLPYLKQSLPPRFDKDFSRSHFTYAACILSFIFQASVTMDISGSQPSVILQIRWGTSLKWRFVDTTLKDSDFSSNLGYIL